MEKEIMMQFEIKFFRYIGCMRDIKNWCSGQMTIPRIIGNNKIKN